VDGDATDVVVAQLDLASVEAGPDLEVDPGQLVAESGGAADRPAGAVEGRQDAVAGGLDELTAELLGRRPDEITATPAPPKSYRELNATIHDAVDVLAEVEYLVPEPRAATALEGDAALPSLGWLQCFCLTRNDKLLRYWDVVEDRLFKIRHCQNIAGIERQLALFEPKLDPGLLTRAAAAGLDVGVVLQDANTPVPQYRFTTMTAKATELATELKSLSAGLLAALEKRDAEALARLRSSHELNVLDAVRQVRIRQVDEAEQSLAALRQSRAMATHKQTYYTTRPFMNSGETAHTILSGTSIFLQGMSAQIDMAVSVIRLLPDIKIGVPTTMGASFGGSNLGDALKGLSGSLNQIASTLSSAGSLSATIAGYQRRMDDWKFQAEQAGKEIEQLDKQIAATSIRLDIARKELDNQDLQIANAQEADEFMRTKFTNQELYDWTAAQLAGVYFSSYQVAYDVAKRAEQCYRHELALQDSGFVRFGYWDTLHKGLLSGERMYADLKRMEASYLELNRRELELTKRISLAQLDPEALVRLRTTGECFVNLPEVLFDLDCPGHYLRRIKSVSFRIPCIAGPYTSVNCTATLLRSSVRMQPNLFKGRYGRQDKDPRFRDYTGSVETVVTSTARGDDSGMFETNLRDERYLPFQESGVVGEWRLRLPREFPQFDYASITDLVMTVRYTARDGGEVLATQASQEIRDAVNTWVNGEGHRGLFRMFSGRTELSDEWNRFLYPAGEDDQEFRLTLSKDQFPTLFVGRKLQADQVHVLLALSEGTAPGTSKTYRDAYAASAPLPATLSAPGGSSATQDLTTDDIQVPKASFKLSSEVNGTTWRLIVRREDVAQLAPELKKADDRLNPDAFADLIIIVHYTLS
jgi:hypothetical protein